MGGAKRKGLFSFFLFLIAAFSGPLDAAQYQYGKYFGAIRMEGSSEPIAVSFDTFITQRGKATDFPELVVLLKVSLGGYESSEYVTYQYVSPSYDYDNQVLALDDPSNDLAAILKVSSSDAGTTLEGPVVDRTSRRKGTMRVFMESDDGGERDERSRAERFLSKLSGEYRGKCGDHEAALELETGRGVGEGPLVEGGMKGYAITGRLGFADPGVCPPFQFSAAFPHYCSMYQYSNGAYFLFADQLELQGPHARLKCSRKGNALHCTLKSPTESSTCDLAKSETPSTPPRQYPRLFYLKLSPESKKPMPPFSPPNNKGLLDALTGDYYGFLHHESRDQYQLIAMNVMASTSTGNPHVQNEVFVTPTVSAFLGRSWDSTEIATARFTRREFYVKPGYMMYGPDTDSFLVVDGWTGGHVRGVWYSKSYGRVGTFEFQKNERPQVPEALSVVPSLSGEYEGPTDNEFLEPARQLRLSAPSQLLGAHDGIISVLGQYRLGGGLTALIDFEQGALDVYSASLVLSLGERAERTLITGDVRSESTLSLVWPGAPQPFVSMDGYGLFPYPKAGSQ